MISKTIFSLVFLAISNILLVGQSYANDLNEVVQHEINPSGRVTLSAWTQQRMAAAKPLNIRQRERQFNDHATIPPVEVNTHKPLTINGRSNQSQFPPTPQKANPKSKQTDNNTQTVDTANDLATPLAGQGYPWVYSSYELNPNHIEKYKFYPYRAIGKLFFSIPGEGDFVCSASIVETPNLSSVWTAGHCVYSAGIGFHDNIIFAPARFEGTNPFATWTANKIFIPAGWELGMLEYDSAGLTMFRGGPGAANFLVGQVGTLGITFNQPRQQHWEIRGYPAAAPFNGEHHHVCASTWAANDQPDGTAGVDPQTIGVGCDMTGGSSGGAWLLDLNDDKAHGTHINGNVSYGYINRPDEYYSPYFSDAQINIYTALENEPTPD